MLHTSKFRLDAADARASETQTLGLPSLKFNAAYTRLSDVPSQAFVLPANAFGPGLPAVERERDAVADDPGQLYAPRDSAAAALFTGGKISGAIDAAQENAIASEFDLKKRQGGRDL